jgi:uncharacterized protein YcnI
MKRLITVGAVVVGGLLAGVGTAQAHVVALPGTATQGSMVEIAFQVPDDEPTADTTTVAVTFPAAHPIASVVAKTLPGWQIRVDRTKLAEPLMSDTGPVTEAVSKITWSGGKIRPDNFEDFTVALGPLPSDTDRLVFAAVQTYDNGDVERWTDSSVPGLPAPEHAAPTVTLLTDDPLLSSAATNLASTSSVPSSPTPNAFVGPIGILIGLVAGVLAMLTLWRTRR